MIEPGTVVAAHYKVGAPIASGAMSIVFEGTHTGDGHPVAIKVMLEEFARDPIAVQRFMREARAAQHIEHPNVVKVEDFGLVDEGRPCVVMELLVGETLEARIQQRRLSLDEVGQVVAEAAAGLDAAHAAGIVHRDMKPANCYMARERDGVERLKVLDFGFAKLADHLAHRDGLRTASNALLGTPLYMSPEQIRSSRDVDLRTDVWALGVMSYELLTGEAPFRSRAIADLFVEILTEKIARPSEKNPALTKAVDAYCVRALQRDRDRRFASAGALAACLSAALKGEMPDGDAPSERKTVAPPKDEPARPSRLRWGIVAAALVGLAALLALGLGR